MGLFRKLAYKIVKNLVEGRLLKVIINLIKQGFNKLIKTIDWGLCFVPRYLMSKSSKVQNNKVVFMTYNNNYMCNPKYICEELRRQELPLDIVWATTTKKLTSGQFPEGVRLVVRGTFDFFKEVATAKVWVDNALCFPWNPLPKKKEQFYLQTWHGSMGLKRIGTEDVKNRRWTFSAKLAKKWTDVCISNSAFETAVFRQTHWPDTPIEEFGHARNDILFAEAETKAEIVAKIRDFFGVPQEKKIALYAPTFRDAAGADAYSLDYTALLDALEEKFGGEWVLFNRFHFKTKRPGAALNLDERIYPATAYPDMQELMVAADLGITDYSSWICDFVLTGKPGFIFAPDLQAYDQERGFYYPLSDTPFPIAENNEEMRMNIQNFDQTTYDAKREVFLQARGCKEDGNATARIVDLLKNTCQW